MIPLLRELGVNAHWNIISGTDPFYQVTKKFHNALHGKAQNIPQSDLELFMSNTQQNIEKMDLFGDIMFIHDPQPIGLIQLKEKTSKKWIWRCHIDISRPNIQVWDFLSPFITQYDAAVFSAPAFSPVLPIRQFLISPSIDPLSDKNKELPEETINAVMAKYGIPRDKPIITQVSRFDYLKDPVGVIQAFELVSRNIDCRLVLAGGTATDDPESDQVLAEVKERAGNNPNIHILLIPPNSDLEINALQRGSDIIVQKSLGEGFGLTVSEGLWKGKPVVATAVGGIPLQVKHRETGLLSYGIEGTALSLRRLLNNPEYAKWLGKNAQEHVKYNFLITRHIKDYLILFLSLFNDQPIIELMNTMERK